MKWVCSITCLLPTCGGLHRLTLVDLRPPDPAKVWCYSCPFRGRVVVVNIRDMAFVDRRSEQGRCVEGKSVELFEWWY